MKKKFLSAISDIIVSIITIVIFAAVIYGVYYMIIKVKQ